MNIKELKKEYKNYLNDTKKEDTKRTKQKFKNDCLNWFIEFYGVGSDEVLQINNILKEL